MEEKQESDKFLAVRRSKRRLLLQWCLSVCSSVTHLHTVLKRLKGLVTSNQYWLHELHHFSDTFFNFIFFISARTLRAEKKIK